MLKLRVQSQTNRLSGLTRLLRPNREHLRNKTQRNNLYCKQVQYFCLVFQCKRLNSYITHAVCATCNDLTDESGLHGVIEVIREGVEGAAVLQLERLFDDALHHRQQLLRTRSEARHT